METVLKTRPNVPLSNAEMIAASYWLLKLTADQAMIHPLKQKHTAVCSLGRVVFQAAVPHTHSVALSPAWGWWGLWVPELPPIKASHRLCPLSWPACQLQTGTKTHFGEWKSSRCEISPAFLISFPLTPRSSHKFGVCCLLLSEDQGDSSEIKTLHY